MGLKYSVNMLPTDVYHLGFVVLFIDHRQGKFSVILKDPRISRMVNEHELQLPITSSVSPYRRVSLTTLKLCSQALTSL